MIRNFPRHSPYRTRTGSTEIPQFMLVVYILFLVMLIPLLNLFTLLLSAAIQYLATNDFASKSSTQPDYTSALNSMVNEAHHFQSLGLAKLTKLAPAGGYGGCGDDLYILSTDINSGAVTSSKPDQPLNLTIDTKKSIYELSVRSFYSVSPLISLTGVPLLNQVPGLGQPVTLTFIANRPVEHPGGLQGVTANSGSGSGAVKPFPRVTAGLANNLTAIQGAWRNPNIFTQIQNAGETVLGVNVVLVNASNPNWTQSGLSITPGDQIWIDTQSVGQWNSPGYPTWDANGMPGNSGCPGTPCLSAPFGSLVGDVGAAGPIQANQAGSFFLGNNQYNYPPPGTGTFSMAFNDWSYSTASTGSQLVRVIVVN
jgi:hypothetical protein